MIVIKLNQPQFEYDIYSLVKAFYPNKGVKVTAGEKEEAGVKQGLLGIKIVVEETRLYCRLETTEQITGKEVVLEKEAALEPGEERSSKKSKLKRLLYEMLSAHTGQKLPWGNLTGIRPTKIAYTLLEEGKSQEEIIAHMQEVYQTSPGKARLSVDIAERERRILSALHYEDGYSLYVGIPFCPTTCMYCSFTAYPIGQWKKRVEDYLTALEREMDEVARLFRHKILDTVYVGGGTPTTLEPEEMARLINALQNRFDFSTVQEFTVEAGRADSITEEKLRIMKQLGVDRISVNPQTMKEETLKIIGRHHTVEQVKESFLLARRVGFTNINMDLILGLPGESREDVARTMEEVVHLEPDSLTVHSLAIKRASRMNQWIEEQGIETLHNTQETMGLAADAARRLGMEPYYLYRQKNMAGNLENVGYAKAGSYGIYNILMMEEKQTIAALGAGTVSKRVYPDGQIERRDNVKAVELYIQRIEEMIERKKTLFADC